jgi:hypothetical protein
MIKKFYIPRKVKRLFFAFVSLLTLALILLTSLPSHGLIPDAAYIVKFQGSRLTLGAGTSRNRQPVQLQDRLESNRILYVPGDNQHWANLAFAVDSPKDHTGLVVRAGPHRTASQWSFPCTARGGFTIGWQRGRNRGCEEGIRVQSSGSATSQLLTRKALTAQGRNEVVVVPTPGESLIQTSDSTTGVIVDVLIGEVSVQSDRHPQGRPIRAGQRYAYPEDTVTQIDRDPILNSPEIQDFLNPNNWSSPNLPDRTASSIIAQLTELATAARSSSPTIASNLDNRPTSNSSCSLTGRWIEYIGGEISDVASGILDITQNENRVYLGKHPYQKEGLIVGNRIQFDANSGSPEWRLRQAPGTISNDCNQIDLGLWSDTDESYILRRHAAPYCPLTGRWEYSEYNPVDPQPYDSWDERRFAQPRLSQTIEIQEDSNGLITISGLPNTVRPAQTQRHSTSFDRISLALSSGSGFLNGSIKIDENRIEGYVFSGQPNGDNVVNQGSYRMTRLVPCPSGR